MHEACSIIHFGHLFHLLCKINIFAVKLSGSDLIFDLYSIELFLKLEIQHSDNFAGTFFLLSIFHFFWYRQFLMIQGIFPLFLRLWIASISFYLIWLISFPCMPNYAWNRSQFCFSYTAHVLIYLCKIQFVSHFLSPFFHCHFFFLRCNCLCRIVADDHVTHITTLPWLLSLK